MAVTRDLGDNVTTMGRPRTFDKDQALDRALDVFWRKGYEGATICDLTEAMGINPPSLYAAFGNKEALFCRALERYSGVHGAFWVEALAKPTARGVAQSLLIGAAKFLTDSCHPRGCLGVQSALVCGDEALSVRKALEVNRAASQAKLRERLKQAKVERDLPRGADPATLARYLSTVVEGMAVQAASGASRKELEHVAEAALRGWPN
jgi:AcrR family transcriptional regulator